MKTIPFDTEVLVGTEAVTTINVMPITFVEFGSIWRNIDEKKSKASVQRGRIKHQVHFLLADGKRVEPNDQDIRKLPISVAKLIIDALDEGQGEAGKLLSTDANGITVPIHYKLGTPIQMTSTTKGVQVISELEFKASVYGDIEDVLAADNSIEQTIELLRKVAKPVEVPSLTALPGWAVDRITIADGVTISNNVLPRFLS